MDYVALIIRIDYKKNVIMIYIYFIMDRDLIITLSNTFIGIHIEINFVVCGGFE